MNYHVKNKALLYCLIPIACCLLIFSCHDTTETLNIDYKYEYFPVDSGHYVTYEVDSIFSYNTTFKKDTAHYQLKELITDTFYDNLNQLNYELSLYRRPDNNSPWVFDRKWKVLKSKYNVQKIEDDLDFVKLVFPPIPSGQWNGNIYLPITDPYRDFKNWDYRYESVDVPYSINGFSFDSALIASEVNDSSFIGKRLRKEVYAKHVGMIYQEFELKTKQTITSWDTGKWNGFSLRMKLIDHN